MVARGMMRRIAELEGGGEADFKGPALLVVRAEGESEDQAITRWEEQHGEHVAERLVLMWESPQ